MHVSLVLLDNSADLGDIDTIEELADILDLDKHALVERGGGKTDLLNIVTLREGRKSDSACV
jgi:hypothetical protein